MFYPGGMRVDYREEPCRTALNRVKGMPFDWSLNPYTGCAHRCTFCYVRAFEARADRPSDDRLRTLDPRQGQRRRRAAARARAAVLEAGERRGRRCDRPVPARRGALPADARVHRRARPQPHAVLAHHARPDGRGGTSTCSSRRPVARRCTSASRCRRSTSGSGARPSPARRRRADGSRPSASSTEAGIDSGVALAPILPGLSDDPELLADVVREARAAGATGIWANVLYLRPGHARALPRGARARLARAARPLRAALRGARVPPRGRDGARPRDRASASRESGEAASADARARARARAARALVVVRARNRPLALVESPTWRRTARSPS